MVGFKRGRGKNNKRKKKKKKKSKKTPDLCPTKLLSPSLWSIVGIHAVLALKKARKNEQESEDKTHKKKGQKKKEDRARAALNPEGAGGTLSTFRTNPQDHLKYP
jgi:hypothetical protein